MRTARDFDIAIIGAGAAGLMAAVSASELVPGRRILLLEKNDRPGKKLYATGNGRCNFLNRGAEPAHYFSRESAESVEDWVAPVLQASSPAALESLFDGLGVTAVHLEEGRLYPRSLQAESVVEALADCIRTRGVELRTRATVVECRKTADGFILKSDSGETHRTRCVLLATGGKAGIQYGSSGDGYKIATSLGHRLAKPIPALTQIVVELPDAALSGVRVRGAVSLWRFASAEAQEIARDEGEIQLTPDGISGICTFNISRYYEIAPDRSYAVQLDFFPEYEDEELLKILKKRKQQLAGRSAGTFLNGLLPAKLAAHLMAEVGVDSVARSGSLEEEQLHRLVAQCKRYERRVAGTKSWKHAQVTAGGVLLREVDPGTLQSKKTPSLYFAGEILDVDGPCGGFNLTWAFASGRVAGLSAGRSVASEENVRSSPAEPAAP